MQIGQVIQVYPHQVLLMGMIPAMVIAVTTQFFNYFTLWLLIVLYMERKRVRVSNLDMWHTLTTLMLSAVHLGA